MRYRFLLLRFGQVLSSCVMGSQDLGSLPKLGKDWDSVVLNLNFHLHPILTHTTCPPVTPYACPGACALLTRHPGLAPWVCGLLTMCVRQAGT